MEKSPLIDFRFGLAFIIANFILIFGTLTTHGEPGGGSTITCYSTFAISGPEGACTYLVVDCGTCKEKTCYEYVDAGTCKSQQWVWEPPSDK